MSTDSYATSSASESQEPEIGGEMMAPASRKTAQDHFFTPQAILLEIALFFQTLYFVVCFIMCVCMYVLSLLHLHCLSWIYIISIVDRGPTVGPTDGHGPGLFDLCTVAVRSRSGYLGLPAVHGPLKSSGPRQHSALWSGVPPELPTHLQ